MGLELLAPDALSALVKGKTAATGAAAPERASKPTPVGA
jgi:hypothetical protein